MFVGCSESSRKMRIMKKLCMEFKAFCTKINLSFNFLIHKLSEVHLYVCFVMAKNTHTQRQVFRLAVNTLVKMPTSPIRVTGFSPQFCSCLQLLANANPGSQWVMAQIGSCHPRGRPELRARGSVPAPPCLGCRRSLVADGSSLSNSHLSRKKRESTRTVSSGLVLACSTLWLVTVTANPGPGREYSGRRVWFSPLLCSASSSLLSPQRGLNE